VFNAFFWPYLVGSSVVLFFPALLIFLATAPFDPRRRLLGKFTAEWAAHYLERAPFASVTVKGQEHVDASRTVIYVSNHQSMVDTLAVFSVRAPALWVSKVENFYAPFLGWNMALNRYIALKRGYLPSIMRMYRTCLRRLAAGDSLMVFPEGTRSLDGNLREFYRGAFALSTRARVPIVPIVLEGTGEVLKKGSASITPTHVDVTVLPAIDPAEVYYDSRRLCGRVREAMAAELARIRARRAGAPAD
jgi:1-acyl-sn-glycerol-3-phosphate acyltransferase